MAALPQDLFDKVTRAWAVQDYGLGERLLAEARKSDPNHWHLRTCHAAALGHCSRFSSARRAFDALIADVPPDKRLHMHGLLGVEWCRIGRHDLALPLLRIAADAPPPQAPILEALATALDHLRHHDEALALLDDAQRLFPQHPGLLLVEARIRRQLKQFDLAERAARMILANAQASSDTLARAGHELGHALDAQARYAEAFAAYTQAKQVRHAELMPFLPIWQRGLHLLRDPAIPSRHDLDSWQRHAQSLQDPPRRLAALVGCPRSGTTLLERILDAHPDIQSASETHIFNNVWNSWLGKLLPVSSARDPYDRLTPDDVRQLRACYWDQMEDALEQSPGTRLLLDKNPSLLPRLVAITTVHPEVRIVMALRDPRAIAWSAYSQYLPTNAESAAFNSLATTATHVDHQLRFWLTMRERLNPDCWHESHYERLVTQLETEASQTLDFLGLSWDPAISSYHHNPSPVRSPTYAEAAQPIYQISVEKWRNYEQFAPSHFDSLAPLASILNIS